MTVKTLSFRILWASALFFVALSLKSQTDQFELEAGDRLYAFELARIQHNFDAMLDLTYPDLFRLIDRESLREQMALLSGGNPQNASRLPNFRIKVLGDPIETNERVYLRVQLSYDNWEQAETGQGVQRTILAIRNNNQLAWYFLELGAGQKELFSAIIPNSLL